MTRAFAAIVVTLAMSCAHRPPTIARSWTAPGNPGNALVGRIEQRIAELTRQPLENGEGLQVLRYPVGASSAPHFDFLEPNNEANRASIARSGQRLASLVAYLNDVEEGGETFFSADVR